MKNRQRDLVANAGRRPAAAVGSDDADVVLIADEPAHSHRSADARLTGEANVFGKSEPPREARFLRVSRREILRTGKNGDAAGRAARVAAACVRMRNRV